MTEWSAKIARRYLTKPCDFLPSIQISIMLHFAYSLRFSLLSVFDRISCTD